MLDIHITGAARGFIGTSEPAWIEEAIWHPERHQWEWVVKPEVAENLLDARGFVSLQDGSGTTARVVHGDVRVKVPLYGGKVEGWIVDGLEHAYAEEAERLQAWLDHPRK